MNECLCCVQPSILVGPRAWPTHNLKPLPAQCASSTFLTCTNDCLHLSSIHESMLQPRAGISKHARMLLLRFCPTTIYASNYRLLFPQFTTHIGVGQNCSWTNSRTLFGWRWYGHDHCVIQFREGVVEMNIHVDPTSTPADNGLVGHLIPLTPRIVIGPWSDPRVWPSNTINGIPTPYVPPLGGQVGTTWCYDGSGDFNPTPTAVLITQFQTGGQTGNLFLYNEVRLGRG
jgi:hypothetical protein